jgi:hypothetical protein
METANQGLLSKKKEVSFPFQECSKGLSNGV